MEKIAGRLLIVSIIVASLNFSIVAMAETNKVVVLPEPDLKGAMPLEQTIFRRRSERKFRENLLDQKQIGQLLWAAQGITWQQGKRQMRAAPSAGALYPLEVYAVMKEGTFRYIPERHALSLMKEGDLRPSLSAAAWGQAAAREAPLSIVICAVYERVTGKYGERGERYVHMEAGHAAENIHLQAVALGLGSLPVGAFEDSRVSQILNLPEDQKPLYIIPVGYIP